MEILREPTALSEFVRSLSTAPFIALDTETTGLDPHTDKLLLVQVGTADRQGLIDAESMTESVLREIFRPDRLVVLQNATFDLKMLGKRYGAWLDPSRVRIADTLLAEILLRNGRSSEVAMNGFALKVLAMRYAGMELDKSIRQGFMGAASIQELSETELRYAARDVEATWKVFAEQLKLLEKENLLRALAIEGSAAIAFAAMELVGTPIDTRAWQVLVEEEAKERAVAKKRLDREFWAVANLDLFGGTTLNYDSDEEVLPALKKLGVDLTTTRREALLASGHSAALALAEYREHQKIVSTYGQSFLAHVHSKTGRIHPHFSAMGAITGRASCKDPNLQNIPRGSAFRACFKAAPGRRLIAADYSGAELRIIAELSEDPVFIRTFCEGGDLHAMVASRVFRKPVSKTENVELRSRAKAINFGLVYGMGAQGLAQQIGAPLREAERLLEEYFRSFPKIRDYLQYSARQALKIGRAETLAGRRYWFIDMRREGKDEAALLRVAKNMPIQGTSADITKLAMARATVAFHRHGLDASLINMVHDELVVEASEADAMEAQRILVREMTAAGAEFLRCVPTEVDSHIDSSWSK